MQKLWTDPEGAAGKSKIRESINRLLVIQTFRPDRLVSATTQFVGSILGSEFVLIDKKELNLGVIIEREVPSPRFLLISSRTLATTFPIELNFLKDKSS